MEINLIQINLVLEKSLNKSIKQARQVWGSNFLKIPNHTIGDINNSAQKYNYSIQEEPDLNAEEKSERYKFQDSQTIVKRSKTEKDLQINKSQSNFLPQYTQSNSKEQYRDYTQYKQGFNDSQYNYQTNSQIKERELFGNTLSSTNQKFPKKYMYTNSHSKIKLY